MQEIEHTKTFKSTPTLARFYDWVKQRKGYALSPWANKVHHKDHTNDNDQEKKYVTTYSKRI